MRPSLMIVGEGVLAETVKRLLKRNYDIVGSSGIPTRLAHAGDFVLVLQDEWRASFYQKADEMMRPAGIPWLSGYLSEGEGVIGPYWHPNAEGCAICAYTRRKTAGSDRAGLGHTLRELILGEVRLKSNSPRKGLSHMALLLEAEIQSKLEGKGLRTDGSILIVKLETLESSRHAFLPDPLCPVCSRMKDDHEGLAGISLAPSLKLSDKTDRCKSLGSLKESLKHGYLDDRTGLLTRKELNLQSPFADVSVSVPSVTGTEITAGRTHAYTESELTAMLEGLERYCGMYPRGKRTRIIDSYRNLSGIALNPHRVGIYSEEQYRLPDFPFQPFDPDRPIEWVWGYSFLQQCTVLVPESLAYYGQGSEHAFVDEGSNGSAIGGSLEEAIFYGILEVVERDAFLMTWYARLPVPRIDPRSSDDLELSLMVDRMESVTGYEVYLFNTTMEHGIPSVAAVAKNRNGSGVNLVCAAGAHLNPVKAAKSAIHEIAGILPMLNEAFEQNREACLQMLADPSQVARMGDHALLYGLPEAEHRLTFLLDEERETRTFEETFAKKNLHTDLSEDLKEVLLAFSSLGLEVIAVNQTAPEIEKSGLYCVKVLIPGMLPMTFGHDLIRLDGLDRVFRVPGELGYTDQMLTLAMLNPHPHPFL